MLVYVVLAIPLAEPQCQDKRSGRYGAAAEDLRVRHCGEPEEEIHG